jgi:hypothetical protein
MSHFDRNGSLGEKCCAALAFDLKFNILTIIYFPYMYLSPPIGLSDFFTHMNLNFGRNKKLYPKTGKPPSLYHLPYRSLSDLPNGDI